MKVANQIGKKGEDMATDFLVKKGYRILERNFHCLYGEIDIIAMKKRTIVFIEVKTRTSSSFGLPIESITHHKLTAIQAASYLFRQAHPEFSGSTRIDAIVILLHKDRTINSLEHLENISFNN